MSETGKLSTADAEKLAEFDKESIVIARELKGRDDLQGSKDDFERVFKKVAKEKPEKAKR